MQENNKVNWFVRFALIFLIVFIAILIFFSFFRCAPFYNITAGIILLILIMSILVLSESFNTFSIGRLFSLSKEVEKKESERIELKKENAELRQSIIQLATNIQSQVNTTIQAQGTDILQLLKLVKADEKDKEESQQEIPISEQRKPSIPLHKMLHEIEEKAFEKFFIKYNLILTNLLRDMTFTDTFQNIDPISNRKITFDGFYNSLIGEQFFEVRPSNRMSSIFLDRLYIMLSKVLLYKNLKKINAELILLIVKIPNEEEGPVSYPIERLFDYFQPAISSGLLRVEIIDLSEEEYDHIRQKASHSH